MRSTPIRALAAVTLSGALATALVSACGGSGGGTAPEPVASVNVSAAGGSNIVVGQTLQLAATLADAHGSTLTGRNVTWSSGSQSIATVSLGGLVTGVAEGSVQITASSEGRSGIIGLQVAFPYPDVSGTYAYVAVFDRVSGNGIGVIAIAQGDRTKPDLQLAPIVDWRIWSESFTFTSAYAATISQTGSISFRMGAPSTTTIWEHTGTLTAPGEFTGRHTLAGSTSSYSGNWAIDRASSIETMLVDRGIAVPGDLEGVLKALVRETQR